MLLWRSLINYTVAKGQRGLRVLINFPTENNFLSLKLIFHCYAHYLILAKSLLSLAAELSLLCTTKNKEVSSVNNLVLGDNSFLYMLNNLCILKKHSGPSIEPCGTPTLTLVHVETCTFKTTLCFLFLKKSHNKFKSSPNMSFGFNLKIIPSCHTLSNAFDILSRKTFLTANP